MLNLTELYESVQEFYDVTELDRPDTPTLIDANRRAVMMAYLASEVAEFGRANTLEDQVSEVTDLLYFVIDLFVELGINPSVPISIVHNANMAKIFPDGKAHFDNTVVPPRLLRPEGWEHPDVKINRFIRTLRSKDE